MPCFRAAVASGSSDTPLGVMARACGWLVLLGLSQPLGAAVSQLGAELCDASCQEFQEGW